jgi:hypothetical protein
LNAIPPSAGGASPELIPDGQSGSKTRAAILHFQRVDLGLTEDSNVDPDGSTLHGSTPLLARAVPCIQTYPFI